MSQYRDCLYDRHENILCNENFPHQFDAPVKNIELVDGGYCGVSDTNLTCTFALADAEHGAIRYGATILESLEIQDFEEGDHYRFCVLLDDPRKTVCFQNDPSQPIMDRDRDSLHDLEDVCPETIDNDCLADGKPSGWQRDGHNRIVGFNFGTAFNSSTYGRAGHPADLKDFLLTYNEGETIISGNAGLGLCASG